MIEQVIDKEGKVYDVVYPENPLVCLLDETNTQHKCMMLDELIGEEFRPYKVNGQIALSGLEPWERWGGDAKERWQTLETVFKAAGYTVSHNGQDMKLEKDGLEDWLSDVEIMNFPPEENFKLVERCMYKPEEGPKV